jgi:hypothetical protein
MTEVAQVIIAAQTTILEGDCRCRSWVINGPDRPDIQLPLCPQVGHRSMSGKGPVSDIAVTVR